MELDLLLFGSCCVCFCSEDVVLYLPLPDLVALKLWVALTEFFNKFQCRLPDSVRM